MLAPQPGAVTLLIMNASVAGKYACWFLIVNLIYFSDKQKMHSKRTTERKKERKVG